MRVDDEVTPADRELLIRAYAAYDRQDADALLDLLSDDVDWPDDDGGRIHGKGAVRAYWTEQWSRALTHDEPIAIRRRADGRVAVHIDQIVRSLAGATVSAGRFLHLHRIEAGRISRLDIEALADRNG